MLDDSHGDGVVGPLGMSWRTIDEGVVLNIGSTGRPKTKPGMDSGLSMTDCCNYPSPTASKMFIADNAFFLASHPAKRSLLHNPQQGSQRVLGVRFVWLYCCSYSPIVITVIQAGNGSTDGRLVETDRLGGRLS